MAEKNWIPYAELNDEQKAMVDSDSWRDRRGAAEQGFGLDTLVNDPHWGVRRAVGDQGYGLETLVNDEDSAVRAAVARQGCGLDKLIIDEDVSVSIFSKDYLREHKLTLEEWIEQNPHKCALLENRQLEGKVPFERLDYNQDYTPFDMLHEDLKAIVMSPDWQERKYAAEKRAGLDILVNDVNPSVRAAVADQGFGVYQLVYDEEWIVRVAVAKQGYGLDRLVNDEDWKVREAVAEQRYGYDTLIADSNHFVRNSVKYHLDINSLTIDDWIAQNPDKCALAENQVQVQVEQHDEKQWSATITDYREPDNGRSWVCYGNTPEDAVEKSVKSAEAQQVHIPEKAIERVLKKAAGQAEEQRNFEHSARKGPSIFKALFVNNKTIVQDGKNTTITQNTRL